MDEVLELRWIAHEEDGCVVADQVVIALLGVELDSEASRIPNSVGVALLTRYRREANEHRSALANSIEEGCPGPLRDVGSQLKEAQSAATFSVHDALGHALAIERLHLLDQVVVLEQDRAVGADGE